MPGWPRFFRKSKELDCSETHSLASDYVDGEMGEATMEKMRGHLAWCGPCQAFISTFAKTVGLLKSMPKGKAPQQLKDSIISKIREEGS